MDHNTYYIATETGSVYYLDGDMLMFAPINTDNTFSLNEFDYVDEDLIGEELISDDSTKTLSELYAEIKVALKK